ncbi:Crossover junction endonuclease MUS81 [Hypsibius exemplaris]|uniref:Crossover junction endonuclease MUS81 n=1 Tax=Hypsibius exemplaris TaxID=2072580 RepID=A0A1W0X337_HYPEX|nr:Crossover junction endonuclease MUS81 [Hypsibius exemplaris]
MASNIHQDYKFEEAGYRLLFLEWLQEWKQEAASKGSNAQYCYNNAFKSLKVYSKPVYSGHGCISIPYFGGVTCKKLEKKLLIYVKENKLQRLIEPPGPPPIRRSKSKSPKKKPSSDNVQSVLAAGTSTAAVAKKPRKRPMAKTKSVANVLDGSSSIGEKDDFVPPLPAIPFSMSLPLTAPRPAVEVPSDPPSTASAGVTISSSLSLVPSTSRAPSTSSSTDAIPRAHGLAFANLRGISVIQRPGGGFTARAYSASELEEQKRSSMAAAAKRFNHLPLDEFVLRPGTFDVVLCVDNQEIHGKGSIRAKIDVVSELTKKGLNFDIRSLKVGDFLWIAREKEHLAVKAKRKPRELVLDFIVERKRGDDLAVSIKDGRYTCQKFRMKMSSLRRVIYLVEEGQRFQNKGLSDQAFHQALANIEIQDGFMVKRTDNLEKTANYIVMMTRYLERVYSTKTLTSCSYEQRFEDGSREFNLNQPMHNLLTFSIFSAVSKTNQAKTMSQAFLLQLLALDGISPSKAAAIVAKYPTMRLLAAGYDNCSTDAEKQLLLRDIKFGIGLRNIGPVLSRKLYRLYCEEGALI